MGNYDIAAARLRIQAQQWDVIVSQRKVGLRIAYYLRDHLVQRLVFTRSPEIPTDLPPADRIWVVNLLDHSMLDFGTTGPHESVADLPPAPPNYRMVAAETVPRRKPITLALYERSTD